MRTLKTSLFAAAAAGTLALSVMGNALAWADDAVSTEAEGQTEESVDGTGFKVAMQIGLGGQGDGGFNDALVSGLKAAAEEYGIEYQLVEPTELSEFEGNFMDLSASGEYDLIIGGGFDAVESLEAVAPDFPDQKYLFIDGSVDADNVTSVQFRDNEKTYLIGVIAAMNSESGKIGEIVGQDSPSQNLFVAGYIAGARSVNPDIEVSVKYVGSFSDTTTAKELSLSEAEDGVDIIYATAGGSGLGVFSAADEAGFYAIGVDTNQCLLDPDHVMLSSLRNNDVAVKSGIRDAILGTLEGGVQSLGLAEGALGYTNEGSNVPISDESLAAAEEAKEKIISGEITVPETIEEAEQ